jgi:DNA-binding PadR family transcriptional regulator
MEKKSLGRTQIPNRGIPSNEALCFPPMSRTSDTTDRLGWKSFNSSWHIEDVIKHVFPPTASPKYFAMATEFMRFLFDNLQFDEESKTVVGLTGEEISNFVKKNNFSSGSFYGYVLRKLHNCGLIERRREERKRRSDTGSWTGRMVLQPSRQFITHLTGLAHWYELILNDAEDNAKKKSSQMTSVEIEGDPTESDLDEE